MRLLIGHHLIEKPRKSSASERETIGPVSSNETVARVLEGNYGVLIILGKTLSVCMYSDGYTSPTDNTKRASRWHLADAFSFRVMSCFALHCTDLHWLLCMLEWDDMTQLLLSNNRFLPLFGSSWPQRRNDFRCKYKEKKKEITRWDVKWEIALVNQEVKD